MAYGGLRMWSNSVWGFYSFSFGFFLAVLLLTPEFMLLRPWFAGGAIASFSLGTIILCWPLWKIENRIKLSQACQHPLRWVTRAVQPYHVILLGIAIALIGVVWQYKQTSATPDISAITKPLQDQIDSLKRQLADASRTTITNIRQANSNSSMPSSLPVVGPKKYTAYEKEQRLRAVDEIYNALATQLQPTYASGQKLLDEIYKGDIADAEQRLTDYRTRTQAAFDSLNGLLKKYDYFSDIVQVTKKNTFNDVEATHGVGNLVPEIQALRQKAPNEIQWFLLRDTTMMDARNQIRHFAEYLSDTIKRLQEKRAEIEKAEI
jgi:hypothetical protein